MWKTSNSFRCWSSWKFKGSCREGQEACVDECDEDEDQGWWYGNIQQGHRMRPSRKTQKAKDPMLKADV